MLKAKFFVESSGSIIGFEICGHSGYSERGLDIVCAAVSSAAYMTVNTMADVIGASVEASVNDEVGYMRAEIKQKDVALCSDILKGFKSHLLMLEQIYHKNVNVSYVEV